MILWIFLGIGSGALFSLLLSGFFNFIQTDGRERFEKNKEEKNVEIDAPNNSQLANGTNLQSKESILDLEEKKYESINYQSIGTFFTIFGYLGAFLYENDLKLIFTLIISAGVSFFVSRGVSRFGKYLNEKEIIERKDLHYLIGSAGIVTSGVGKEGIYQIEVEHSGKAVSLSGRSMNEKIISVGKKIIISDFNDKGFALISEDIPI